MYASVWHFQPDPAEHRTACGRVDNLTAPFSMAEDPLDVGCIRCQRTRVYAEATVTTESIEVTEEARAEWAALTAGDAR